VGGAVFWGNLRRGAEGGRIPDLVGMSSAAAREKAIALALEYREIGRRGSEDVAAGSVLTQDPRPGASATPGAVIKVVISEGSDQVVVPQVAEMAPAPARLNLRAAGLAVGVTRDSYDEKVPKGYVRATFPAGGTRAVRGTSVDLEISLGPKPAAVNVPPTPTAPGAGANVPPPPAGKRETVTYRVPGEGNAPIKVTVEMDDPKGRRTIYEGDLKPGDSIPPQTITVTAATTIRILLNGDLREEIPFQP
jgi:beta-lactam-binding protein with PASTA domain